MRKYLKRWRTPAVVVAAVCAVAAVALSVVLTRGDGDGAPSALILDQLSLSQPNPEFAGEATALLEGAGYEVDYVPGEQATVELYRRLPTYGYDILLVRAHAGRRIEDGKFTDYAHLFTGEPYSPSDYVDEQRDGHLKVVAYDESAIETGETFFGIPESFVSERMSGDFDGAAVVLMGCDVLRADALAGSFVERGAGAVVGWDDQVSAAHTDAATLLMLRHMIEDGMPVDDATAAAASEVGPDPHYGAKLVSYERE